MSRLFRQPGGPRAHHVERVSRGEVNRIDSILEPKIVGRNLKIRRCTFARIDYIRRVDYAISCER